MNEKQLSKELSYALRHAPWEYDLVMDHEGWVEITDIMTAICDKRQWPMVTRTDIEQMMARSEKQRFQLNETHIRALYGHSLPTKITKEHEQPPIILYHGTARRFVASIEENGLQRGQRQYVHLSEDEATAMQVGKRRDGEPVLLTIAAQQAYEDGILFYYANETIWLADEVPARYITFSEK